VKDLDLSKEFFSKLGFKFNPEFTDDKAACLIIEENIFAMLLKEDFFTGFSKKAICDTSKANEVLIALSCSSRNEVDELVKKASENGGFIPRESKDHGFMYEHAFGDPDGHIWEVMFMEQK